MEDAFTPLRRTFVVQVHSEGVTTLEDIQSRERTVVNELDELPGLIAHRLTSAPANGRRTQKNV